MADSGALEVRFKLIDCMGGNTPVCLAGVVASAVGEAAAGGQQGDEPAGSPEDSAAFDGPKWQAPLADDLAAGLVEQLEGDAVFATSTALPSAGAFAGHPAAKNQRKTGQLFQCKSHSFHPSTLSPIFACPLFEKCFTNIMLLVKNTPDAPRGAFLTNSQKWPESAIFG